MNKKAAIIIIIILLFALTALIYTRDSCYYQMASVKTTAYLDPETCKVASHPLKLKILNDSKYDIIQYGFSFGAYNKTQSNRVGYKFYTVHRFIQKGSGIEGCFPVPGIKDINLEDIKKDYDFKMKLFVIAFDKGDDKRWTCM